MEVFRITLTEYSKKLKAPGTEGRWNSRGNFVVYTAASRSLACLENLVHRDSSGLRHLFSVLTINIPAGIKIKNIYERDLPEGWTTAGKIAVTRKLGNDWLSAGKTAILKVPSAIITGEFNYLLNPAHLDFNKIRITGIQPFNFDQRLK